MRKSLLSRVLNGGREYRAVAGGIIVGEVTFPLITLRQEVELAELELNAFM